MALSVIPLTLVAVLAHEVVHPDHLDVCRGMAWLLRDRCALVGTTVVKTVIGHLFLESLDLLLELVDLE